MVTTVGTGEFVEKHEAATGKGGSGRGEGREGGGEGGLGAASGRIVSSSGLTQPRQTPPNECRDARTVALAKTGGRALASRAAERRRLLEQQEREAEGELLLRRAEDEAERNVKRYRTYIECHSATGGGTIIVYTMFWL